MPQPALSLELRGRIHGLLMAGFSVRMAQITLKKAGFNVSKSSIGRVKLRGNQDDEMKEEKKKKPIVLKKMAAADFKKLEKMVKKPDPPTQQHMANCFNVSQQTICHHIHHNLELETQKKTKVHGISADNVEKRRNRSWSLYRLLCSDRYKKIITTDEAWFHLSDTNQSRDFHYVPKGKSRVEERKKIPIARRPRFSKGFLVWAGISSRGKTKIHFIKKGVKINSTVYQKMMTKVLAEDAISLYPEGNFILHQDSAPCHVSKSTIAFFEKKKRIKYITKDQWMPQSPDCAPMDFFVWGWMKKRIAKMKVKTLTGLRRAVRQVWDELSQEDIDSVLAAWPKRVRNVHKAKGFNIERL